MNDLSHSDALKSLTADELNIELQEALVKRKKLRREIDSLESILVGLKEELRRRKI